MSRHENAADRQLPDPHERVLAEVVRELLRVLPTLEPLRSPHEGYSVVYEELDELWDEVRGNTGRSPHARLEAVQVAVTAIRYAADLTSTRDATIVTLPAGQQAPGDRLRCAVAGCPAAAGETWAEIDAGGLALRARVCDDHAWMIRHNAVGPPARAETRPDRLPDA